MSLASLHLKPGREKSVEKGHPWVFSGAVARVDGAPGLGETVIVKSSTGEALGLAAYSPQSQIRGRMWSLDVSAQVDVNFLRQRLIRSLAMRRRDQCLAPGARRVGWHPWFGGGSIC